MYTINHKYIFVYGLLIYVALLLLPLHVRSVYGVWCCVCCVRYADYTPICKLEMMNNKKKTTTEIEMFHTDHEWHKMASCSGILNGNFHYVPLSLQIKLFACFCMDRVFVFV